MYLLYVSPGFVKALDDLIRADLQNRRDSYFGWLVFSSVVVVLGVIFEVPEVAYESVDIFPRILSRMFHRNFRNEEPERERHTPDWVKLLALVGLILVVLGVAGEGFAEAYVSRADSTLQTFNDILLGNTIREAGLALERAAEANQQSERLRGETEQARNDVEKERLARLKIEEAVAWRRLSKTQKDEVGTRLKLFAGQLAVFTYNINDIEASTFGLDIASALQSGHWTVSEPQPILDLAEGPVPFGTNPPLETGVLIVSTEDAASRNAADALLHELSTRGFDAKRRPKNESRPKSVVFISIEHRPEGAQGEAKLSPRLRKRGCN